MFLQHPEHPDLSWEILAYDKGTKKAKLRGRYATIEVDFDMDTFKAKGYTLVKGDSNAIKPGVR